MPEEPPSYNPRRVDIEGKLTRDDITALISLQDIAVVQVNRPLPEASWKLLNKELFAIRPELELRVYGFYGSVCDLSILQHLTNLRRFSADCLEDATGLEWIAEIRDPVSLAIGVHSLKSFDFLERVSPDHLERLRLMETKSKKLNVEAISRFDQLQELTVAGHTIGLESIATLKKLDYLTLVSSGDNALHYAAELPVLHGLNVRFGKARSLEALSGNDTIEELELMRLTQLADISPISKMRRLKRLNLSTDPRITALPELPSDHPMEQLWLHTLTGFKDLSAVQRYPNLQEFLFIDLGKLEPEAFLPVLRNRNLKSIRLGFSIKKWKAAFMELAAQEGVPPEVFPELAQ